ncbi:unnamed protein product [Sphenostylis stenocarpa]|uniref:Uncharacterized protein n=1 Tax=Sphenostylis stenocarpa TaxID=92480 RepID=A0AA86RXP6_9FABA|nr:unnamed protein product [Sphenostylis stenocarpa]
MEPRVKQTFEPLPISAISGTRTGELLDLVCSGLEKVEESNILDEEENVPAISIVVSPISGTTRDAIDTEFTGPDGQALSVNRAFRAIRRSDVVALVIEAMACITEQDRKGRKRLCAIVVNKWDTTPNKKQQTASHYEEDVREKLRTLDWAPIVYSTAIAGHNVDKAHGRPQVVVTLLAAMALYNFVSNGFFLMCGEGSPGHFLSFSNRNGLENL